MLFCTYLFGLVPSSLTVGLAQQVEPNDPLLTLRLSNRYTATLTSKQLRENAGLGKFPVQASKMKGPRGKNSDTCGHDIG